MSDNHRLNHIELLLNSGKLKPEPLLALVEKFKKPESKYISMFHTYEEMRDAPPVRFLIKDFWQAEGITLLGALAGHDKTWAMIAIVKALLSGEKLFDYFDVLEKAVRIIYLVPEIALGPAFFRFCTKFHLDEYIKDGRLLISTLSVGRKITLTDPELLDKCQGADVFLDTLPRFRASGAKESDADGNKELADQLFNLQQRGARSVGVAQHSPKEFRNARSMNLENIVRGSGDIGAMLATAWGLRKVTDAKDAASNLVYVENIKPRDFAPPESFLLRLRPDIDERGLIGMEKPPGECGSMEEELAAVRRAGGKPDKETWAKAQWQGDKTLGRPRLNELIKKEYGKGMSSTELSALLAEWKQEVEQGQDDQQGTLDDLAGEECEGGIQ